MQHICFVTALAPCLHIICSDPREELLLCYSLITQAPLHLSCSAEQAAAGSSLTLAPSPLASEGSIPGSQHDLEETQDLLRITSLHSPQCPQPAPSFPEGCLGCSILQNGLCGSYFSKEICFSGALLSVKAGHNLMCCKATENRA